MQSSSNRKAPIVSFWSRFPSAVATVPLRVTTHVRTPSCFKSPKLYHQKQYQHVILHPIQDQYSIFWNTSIIVFQCSHLALCTLQQTTNQIKKRDKITITTCEYTRFSPLFLNTITAHLYIHPIVLILSILVGYKSLLIPPYYYNNKVTQAQFTSICPVTVSIP